MSNNCIIFLQQPFIFVPGKSVYFDGTDYARLAYDSRLCDFGTSDWTMEFFVKFPVIPTTEQALFAFGNGGGSASPYLLAIYRPSDNTFSFEESSSSAGMWKAGSPATPIDTTKWYHVCAERYNNVIKLYLNGSNTGGTGWTNAGWNGTHQTGWELDIGALHYANQGWSRRPNAYMSNLRINKGTAIYRGNFTPPKSKLTALPSTVLLTLNEDTLIDAGPYHWPIYTDGTTPTVDSATPFVAP